MIESVKKKYTDLDGSEHNVTIFKDKSIEEKISTVSFIVGSLVNEKDKFYSDLAFKLIWEYYIIKLFTDVEVDVNSLKEVDEFVNGNNLFYLVLQYVDEDILLEIKQSVYNNICYKTGIKFLAVEDALSNLITEFSKKVKDTDVNDLVKTVKSFNNNFGVKDTEEISSKIVGEKNGNV